MTTDTRPESSTPATPAPDARPTPGDDAAATPTPGTGAAPAISRRAFLAGSAAVVGAAGVSSFSLAACESTPYLPYPSPSRFIQVSASGLEVGIPRFVEFELSPGAPAVPDATPPVASMPPGRGGAWLVKQEDGSVVAFVPFCTHHACVYDWKPEAEHFLCPCHPGKFALDGTVISGPPPGPLWRFETRQTGADTIEIGWADQKTGS